MTANAGTPDYEDAPKPEEAPKPKEAPRPDEAPKGIDLTKLKIDLTKLNLETLEAFFPAEEPAPKKSEEQNGNSEDEFEMRRKRFFEQ
jgi:hypothetical protein